MVIAYPFWLYKMLEIHTNTQILQLQHKIYTERKQLHTFKGLPPICQVEINPLKEELHNCLRVPSSF